ncbi:hypothetical protein N5J44_00120 [Acinetobacter ursingii]|uniref:hypothetical protein n=1 Tax=Acinetobacter ursingii TaxID=108980 RepID=UPI00244B3820|nr:hypothetical protein [Acinetobacter ursingii]MDH2017871.1 hypothetical protein [Acinetobacter ursingii]MDH2069968.1 hypothetical protein [Acinetobacter ursingii]
MINLNYLSPIVSSITNTRIIFKGRAVGRSFGIIGICANALPMLDWDYSHTSICFNPKKIPKVPNRKQRKACYQAFALYKKSFKPTPKPKLKIWRDEWPRLMKRAIHVWSDHMADAFSFFAHYVDKKAKFAAQYECRWDLSN